MSDSLAPNYLCRECGFECETEDSLVKHLARHHFVPQLRNSVMVCWFCSAYMAEPVGRHYGGVPVGIPWSIKERIGHIIGCYEAWRAGADVATDEHRRRTEMVMGRSRRGS